MVESTCFWIDDAPRIEIDAHGVRISGENGSLRMSRATFRQHVEDGLRLLDLFDRSEQSRRNVIAMRAQAAK